MAWLWAECALQNDTRALTFGHPAWRHLHENPRPTSAGSTQQPSSDAGPRRVLHSVAYLPRAEPLKFPTDLLCRLELVADLQPRLEALQPIDVVDLSFRGVAEDVIGLVHALEVPRCDLMHLGIDMLVGVTGLGKVPVHAKAFGVPTYLSAQFVPLPSRESPQGTTRFGFVSEHQLDV